MPSENQCTVVISGEEDEVLELTVAHAVSAHGHIDNAELRDELRSGLRDDEALDLQGGAFLRLIEFRTRDLDRVRALVEDWRQGIGREGTARWPVITADRGRSPLREPRRARAHADVTARAPVGAGGATSRTSSRGVSGRVEG